MRQLGTVILALASTIALISMHDPPMPQHGSATLDTHSPPRHTPAQKRELRNVIRELTSEARDRRTRGLTDDAAPDFAARHDGDLSIQLIQEALLTSQHRDPFIDAYIRWQLLSYEPPFPELDDRAYLRLLRELPALIENPRGDPSFLNLIERAEQMDAIPPDDFERLRQLDAQSIEHMAIAESLNRPALALRDWVRDGVADSTVRTIQLMIEECAAQVDGAWLPATVKGNLTRAFTIAASELTVAEKRLLADHAHGLVGRERRFVKAVTFFADRSINVSYSRPAVSQRDYDRWMQRLAGEE